MYKGSRILAIIPARSGSKGLANKNIRRMCGKPLIAHSIALTKGMDIIDKVFVSTDSEEYAEIAKEYGADISFLRSKELASDTANTWDVVKEVVEIFENNNEYFDIIILLQPTSPLRIEEDIYNALDTFFGKGADVVITVCEPEHSPLLANELKPDGSMDKFFMDERTSLPRQEMPKTHRINGAIYIIKKDYLLSSENIYKGKCYASIMPKERSIDIDDEMDFLIAEMILSRKWRNENEVL